MRRGGAALSAGAASCGLAKALSLLVPLRVAAKDEEAGLDLATHVSFQ